MGKYSKEEIQKAILASYGKQKNLAEKMGISENALSNKIKRGSDKFVRELEVKYGIEFEQKAEKQPDDKDELIAYLLGKLKVAEEEIKEKDETIKKLSVESIKIDNLPKKESKVIKR